MCVEFCCTFVFPLISLVFTLFNLVTDWMSFFQYVSAPSNLLEFNLVTAVVYCVLGCFTGTINLILEVRLFRERIIERKENKYGTPSTIKGGMGANSYRRQFSLAGPEKYLSFILPLLLSIILLQDIPSVIINTVFINYCANVSVQPCATPIPYFPCSILGFNIPPQGMPLVQFLTLASSILSLLGTSIRLIFAPIYICRGTSGCCRRCCGDDDDEDDDYDEDQIKCCCTQNLCAKIFFVIFSFFVFILGLVVATVVVNLNFVDSSLVMGEESRGLGDQWHVPPVLSNDTLTFSGYEEFNEGGSLRSIKFALSADLKQLVAHGSGGLFITYKAKCKDILYNGVPRLISINDRRVDHVWQTNAHTLCHAQFAVKKAKSTRRQPSERLKEANCTGSPIWNDEGNCNALFRVIFDRKRSPPISFSAVPVDSHGQVRNDGGNPFSDACAVNKFWRQNTLKATFISSCRRRRLDCAWVRRHLASFLPESWIDFITSLLPFCPRQMEYNQRPDSCLLVDADARSRYQHVTLELHHPAYNYRK